MPLPKLIIFTHNLNDISASSAGHSYQQVLDEFDNLATTFLYGPGYPEFLQTDSLEDVIAKAAFRPDMLVFAHQWLIDTEGDPAVDPLPSLSLRNVQIPKVCLFNKEYVNLENKLKYLKTNRFDLVFSHSPLAPTYSERIGIPVVFLPFGYNHRVFRPEFAMGKKPIDLLFSGILRNTNPGVQSELRRRIMRELYHSIGDIPLLKKTALRELNIFFNGQPQSRIQGAIASILGTRRTLPINRYVRIQGQSKITLNALSPGDLVSSRHMESMAMKSLVFAEQSSIYRDIFPEGLIVTYHPDLNNFIEKLKYFLDNDRERANITDRAFRHVMANHTWEHRVKTILSTLQEYFG